MVLAEGAEHSVWISDKCASGAMKIRLTRAPCDREREKPDPIMTAIEPFGCINWPKIAHSLLRLPVCQGHRCWHTEIPISRIWVLATCTECSARHMAYNSFTGIPAVSALFCKLMSPVTSVICADGNSAMVSSKQAISLSSGTLESSQLNDFSI